MECCASLASRTQRWPPGATLVSPNARRAWTARAVRPAPPTTISTREGAGCSVPTRPTCCSGSVCVSEDGSQLACDQSCATCNLGTSQSCLTCAPGSLYTELYHTCTPACLHGFYIDEDTSCVPCDSECSTCRGPENTDCTSCEGNMVFTPSLGTCSPQCAELGFYEFSGQCLVCDQACQSCSERTSDDCLSCAPGYNLIEATHTCVSSCPSDFFLNATAAASTCEGKPTPRSLPPRLRLVVSGVLGPAPQQLHALRQLPLLLPARVRG